MLISVKEITVQVGNQQFFENTTWIFERKQNWGMIGKTGAGKSILAKAVCKQVHLSAGHVEYFFDEDHELVGRTDYQPGEIQILSSETHQNFLKSYAGYHQARWQSFEGDDVPTVADILFDPSKIGQDCASTNLETNVLVPLLKLEALLDRKILYLSHGETRKVLIARMLLRAPRLMILDDPYNGLDQESRKVLEHGIERLLETAKIPLLFISSRVEDLPVGIENLILVSDRRVVESGKRELVLNGEAYRAVYGNQGKRAAAAKTEALDRMISVYSATLEENQPDLSEVLRMENVCVSYGNVVVLKEINWTILRGERWALLGHNGAGKSTLLSLILADNPQAYANTICLFGQLRGSGESIWEIKQKIGWVSSELNLYYRKPILSKEVVCSGFFDSIGLYQRCTAEQVNLAQGWMTAFGMDPLADEPFQSLSAGQRRLVMLARALVKNPPLLILDEPCQALDDVHRDLLIGFLDHLCQNTAITLIYVTHYQIEIPESTTHEMRLDHGQILSAGCLSDRRTP